MRNKNIVIDAERRILAILLNYREGIPFTMEHLKSNDFSFSNHRFIYESITNLYEKNVGINSVSLSQELEKQNRLSGAGGIEYISELIELYYGYENLEQMVEIVYTASKQKEFDYMINDYNLKKENTDDMEKLIFELQSEMNKFTFDFRHNSTVSIFEVLKDIEVEMEYLKNNPDKDKGISTGFERLDKTIGLFETQQLIFLCARPAQGKTAFATQLAIKIAQEFQRKKQNNSICLFSLEMKKESIVRRMIGNISGLETLKLKHGYAFNNDELGKWRKGREIFKELGKHIFIEDQSGISLSGIRNKLLKMKREHNTKIAIIDYLQIIGRSGMEKLDEVQAISKLSEGLKHVARELDMVIICLSQLNRGVESRTDKRPVLSDIKGSGSAEAAADIVMALYRADYYKPTEQRTNKFSEMEVLILKNRDGAVGNIKFWFDLERSRFAEQEVNYGIRN